MQTLCHIKRKNLNNFIRRNMQIVEVQLNVLSWHILGYALDTPTKQEKLQAV
jgi:hypothetical protein